MENANGQAPWRLRLQHRPQYFAYYLPLKVNAEWGSQGFFPLNPQPKGALTLIVRLEGVPLLPEHMRVSHIKSSDLTSPCWQWHSRIFRFDALFLVDVTITEFPVTRGVNQSVAVLNLSLDSEFKTWKIRWK